YDFKKLLRLAAYSVVAYSDKPLRLGVKAGFALSMLSCLLGVVLVIDHLFGAPRFPGWTSVIVSIYFMGGMIMASIGIVGIYVGKLFDLAKNRPPYIISDATENCGDLKYYFSTRHPGGPLARGDELAPSGSEIVRLRDRDVSV